VGEYEKVEDARKHEARLIQKYKQLGQAKFNKKMHGFLSIIRSKGIIISNRVTKKMSFFNNR
jgi:hypothetical protein